MERHSLAAKCYRFLVTHSVSLTVHWLHAGQHGSSGRGPCNYSAFWLKTAAGFEWFLVHFAGDWKPLDSIMDSILKSMEVESRFSTRQAFQTKALISEGQDWATHSQGMSQNPDFKINMYFKENDFISWLLLFFGSWSSCSFYTGFRLVSIKLSL